MPLALPVPGCTSVPLALPVPGNAEMVALAKPVAPRWAATLRLQDSTGMDAWTARRRPSNRSGRPVRVGLYDDATMLENRDLTRPARPGAVGADRVPGQLAAELPPGRSAQLARLPGADRDAQRLRPLGGVGEPVAVHGAGAGGVLRAGFAGGGRFALLARRPIADPLLRFGGWLLSLVGVCTLVAMAVPWLSPGPVSARAATWAARAAPCWSGTSPAWGPTSSWRA